MRAKTSELYSDSVRLFALAVLLTVCWLGLNFLFPNLWPTGFPMIVTRLLILATILTGLWLGLRRTDFDDSARVTLWLAVSVPYILWLACIWALALHGVFVPGATRAPLTPVAILVPVFVALILLTRSSHIAALLDAMPPSWLIGVQLYRVFGGIFLVNWIHGAIPGAFAVPAGIGDMTVGLLALPAAVWASSGASTGRKIGIAWNLLGLTDFAVAIATGIMSSPGPLHVLAVDHPNVALGTYPGVMVPAFAVPSWIILHGLSLWQLRRMARKDASAPSISKTG